jgi:uncharacterized glyoxalase superfamily protein PhnB
MAAKKKSSKAKKLSQKPKPAIRKAKATTKTTTRKTGTKMAVPRARKAKPARKKAAAETVGSTVTRSRAAGSAFLARKKPETLRLRSAGPSFTVGDIQQSLKFYCDALGFVAKERWEQEGVLLGVELAAGKVSFWIGQDDWKKGRDRVKGQGFRIYCTTTQDIDALAARIKASGVTLLEEPKDQPWGGRDFVVADPDGFVINIASGL